jgi:hypothetical protein
MGVKAWMGVMAWMGGTSLKEAMGESVGLWAPLPTLGAPLREAL